MELNIFWTEFSQKELEKIYQYYHEKAGTKIAKKVIFWINKKENRIEINDVFDTQQNPVKIERTR